MPDNRPAMSVVTPFFNEEAVLPQFCAELRAVLDGMGHTYEVLLVDDGSTDGSIAILRATDWPQARVIRLEANAGHQDALDAGLRLTRGDWIVTMDADLQHPPSIIPALLAAAHEGNVDVVYAVRPDRTMDSVFKRMTARTYYWSMRRLTGVRVPTSAADFRLMSRRVVDVLNAIPERKVFRLLIPALGFSSTCVPFVAGYRAGGSSKYSVTRMLRLAGRSVVEFSSRPLQIAALLGVIVSIFALMWLVYVLTQYVRGSTVDGWASLTAIVLFLGGIQLLTVGVLGTYVGRIYETLKGRPRYLVKGVEVLGVVEESTEGK